MAEGDRWTSVHGRFSLLRTVHKTSVKQRLVAGAIIAQDALAQNFA
jgi:hypothetical protein